MEKLFIYTYANKSGGTLDDLLNNPFVRVTVLGWGTKWKGHFDKMLAYLHAMESLQDDTIVVCIDGFDTSIVRDPRSAVYMWKKYYAARPLFSMDWQTSDPFLAYTRERVFECRGRSCACAGMYMGYARDIRLILRRAAHLQDWARYDDQRALQACSDMFSIDTQNLVFKNYNYDERKHVDLSAEYGPCFVQYPGTYTAKQMFHRISTLTPFFITEIIALIIVVVITCVALRH